MVDARLLSGIVCPLGSIHRSILRHETKRREWCGRLGRVAILDVMSKHKKQHVIPNCYLKAWCDPLTPTGQIPYIWRISKDGSQSRKRAPEKSFTANDRYTITLPNGERNLVVEHTLAEI